MGKTVTVSADHQTVLKEVLSWNVWIMAPDSARNLLTEPPSEATLQLAKETIGLASTGFDQIMVGLLPSTIVAVEAVELNPESIEALPGIMKLYLNHNQSCLTDTKFLGFPFHYWYTAQFLLILFVVLCVTYATLILRINKKHNFVEQT